MLGSSSLPVSSPLNIPRYRGRRYTCISAYHSKPNHLQGLHLQSSLNGLVYKNGFYMTQLQNLKTNSLSQYFLYKHPHDKCRAHTKSLFVCFRSDRDLEQAEHAVSVILRFYLSLTARFVCIKPLLIRNT